MDPRGISESSQKRAYPFNTDTNIVENSAHRVNNGRIFVKITGNSRPEKKQRTSIITTDFSQSCFNKINAMINAPVRQFSENGSGVEPILIDDLPSDLAGIPQTINAFTSPLLGIDGTQSTMQPPCTAFDLIMCFLKNCDYDLNKLEKTSLSVDQFIEIIKYYNTQVSIEHDPQIEYGCVLKKNLPANQNIVIRGDIHGDLKSLIANLLDLQYQGRLDEKFQPMNNTRLLFLGDYGDRGPFSLEVMAIVACLKAENPDHVFLMRGNHEDIFTNTGYLGKNDQKFEDLLKNEDHLIHLLRFYSTMPLSIYLGEKSLTGDTEYLQFSHGAIELKFDPYDLLHNTKDTLSMGVPIHLELSERIAKLPYDKEKNYKELLAQSKDKSVRKQLKNEWAAQRVNCLANAEPKRHIDDEVGLSTTFNWGDLGEDTVLGDLSERNWTINPEDLMLFLRVTGSKALVRGHQHGYCLWKCGEKVVALTAPVAMESVYQSAFDQSDMIFILETAQKAKNWTCTTYSRSPGTVITAISEKIPFFAKDRL